MGKFDSGRLGNRMARRTSLQTPGSPRKSLNGYPFALSVSLFAPAGTPFLPESLSLSQGQPSLPSTFLTARRQEQASGKESPCGVTHPPWPGSLINQ